MKTLILINGLSGAGKDTFVKFCEGYSKNPFRVVSMHRSDFAKRVLTEMQWDGKKTSEVRELLGSLVDFGENTGFNLSHFYDNFEELPDGSIVFYHVRSPKAIRDIKDMYWFKQDVKVLTILVEKQNKESEKDRWKVAEWNYDYFIDNNGTIQELQEKARDFMKNLMKEENHG